MNKVLKIVKEYRLSLKITISLLGIFAFYGLFSSGKALINFAADRIKINSDNYSVENLTVNQYKNQYYVFTGTALNEATGSTVTFNIASPEIVKANPALVQALVNKLAQEASKEK